MRKETAMIARALKDGKPAKAARTETDGRSVWLHGNKIAEVRRDGHVMLSLCGWNTPTTRERLNGICQVLDIPVRFSQRKGAAVLSEKVGNVWRDVLIDPREMMGFLPEGKLPPLN